MRRIHFAGATRSVKPCHCRLRLQNSFPDKEIGVLLLTIFVRLSISIQTLRMREFFHRNDLIHEIVLLVPNGPMARDAPNSQHPNKWRLIAIPYSKQSYQSRWWPAFWFLGFAWHPGIWGSHFPREHLQRWTTNKNNKRRRKRSGRNIDRNQNKKDGNPKRNYMMRDVILTIYIYINDMKRLLWLAGFTGAPQLLPLVWCFVPSEEFVFVSFQLPFRWGSWQSVNDFSTKKSCVVREPKGTKEETKIESHWSQLCSAIFIFRYVFWHTKESITGLQKILVDFPTCSATS